MRKFFMMVAVVALALLVATPSMALDFKFGAEYRVRFYTMTNQGFDDIAGTNPRGVQTRIRPRFDVSDDNGNMTATLRLEIGDVEWGNGGGAMGVTNGGAQGSTFNPGTGNRVGNGTGGGMGADGVNVETKWAYIDFLSPFGIPLRFRAGIQPWFLPKGIVIDDDVSGLRMYGKYGMTSYDFGWYRANGGPCAATTLTAPAVGACSTTNTADNNLDYYQGKLDFAIAKWINPGIYGIWGRNASSTTAAVSQQYFAGLTVNGDVGFLKYDLDFVYGYQEGGNDGTFAAFPANQQTVQGWGIDAGVHIPIGPVLVHVVGSYGSGDKQDGGKSEALPFLSPSWNGAGGLYELIGSGGAFDATETSQDYPAGLWMIGAGVEYRPVKALWTRLMYGFAGFTGPSANCAYNANNVFAGSPCYGPSYRGKGYVRNTNTAAGFPNQGVGGLAGKSSYGHEVSLRADWDLWTNFKIQGAAGWLIPTGGEFVGEYVLQLYYNF